MKKFIVAASLIAASLLANSKVDIHIFDDMGFVKRGVQVLKAKDLGDVYMLLGKYKRGTFDIFVTKDKKYYIIGSAYDNKTNEKLAFKIDMSKYKDKEAFSTGEGKDEYYVFTDPECPYCKRFERNIPYLKKYAKFHFFLYPLPFHKHAKAMSQYLLSLPKEKRAEALYAMQVKGDESYKKAKYSLDEIDRLNKELQKQQRIADELGVRGTPTVYDKNGKSVNWTTLANKYNVTLPVDMDGVRYLQRQGAQIDLGSGDKDIYIVLNTECPHCRKMFTSKRVDQLKKKYRMHFFLYPSSNLQSRLKTAFILSLKDPKKRADAFEKIMKGTSLNDVQRKKAQKLLQDQNSKEFKYISSMPYVARKMGIRSTPTIFDEEGKRLDPKEL